MSNKSIKYLIVVGFLSISTLFIYPQTNWLKHANNPVLIPGASGSWDETSAV